MSSGDSAIATHEVDSARPSLAAEIWRFLPVWMYLFYGCLLLNTELTNLAPARRDLAYTVVFPLAVFCAFYAVRALKAPDVANRGPLLALALGLAFALPILNLSFHRPSPLAPDTLRFVYELSNFAWAALFAAHAFRTHWSVAVLFFGPALAYGAMLENGGIVLGYFHEVHLSLSAVPPFVAPVATMLGWCVVLYMAVTCVWHLRAWVSWLRGSVVLSALATALVAVLLDLQIDPLATATGCWVWDDRLPAWFEGVPLVNFVAWVCAVAPFALALFWLQRRLGIADFGPFTPRQLAGVLALVPGVLVLAAGAFLASMALVEGVHGPSYAILFGFFDEQLPRLAAIVR